MEPILQEGLNSAIYSINMVVAGDVPPGFRQFISLKLSCPHPATAQSQYLKSSGKKPELFGEWACHANYQKLNR